MNYLYILFLIQFQKIFSLNNKQTTYFRKDIDILWTNRYPILATSEKKSFAFEKYLVNRPGLGTSINLEIKKYLPDNCRHKEFNNELNEYLKKNMKKLHSIHGITIMQRCARLKIPVESVISLSALNRILSKLVEKNQSVGAFEFSNAVYGLRSIFNDPISNTNSNSFDSEKSAILQTVTDIVNRCKVGTVFSGQEIGNIFYGMQYFNLEDEKSYKLLSAIINKVRLSSPILSEQEIGMCLYGFRCMSNSKKVVNEAIEYVTTLIERSNNTLNEQALGLAINGIRCMNCDHSSVRKLIDVLSKTIKSSHFSTLKLPTVTSLFHGLRHMTHTCIELDEFIETIADVLEKATVILNEDCVGQVLGSLKGLSDSEASTRRLLLVLSNKINSSEFKLYSTKLSHSIAGFKNMNGQSDEFKALLTSLVSKIPTNKRMYLGSLETGRLLYGLQNINFKNCNEIIPLLTKVVEWMKYSKFRLDGPQVGLALYGLKSQRYNDNIPIVENLLDSLASKINIMNIINVSDTELNAQTASMAFLGLQGLSSTSAAVRHVIEALTHRIVYLDAQGVGNILYSLRYMTSESKEIRSLLARLAPLINTVSETFRPQELANALWGLQGMDSNVIEVQQIVISLAKQLERIPQTSLFSGQEISIAISGLQTMSADDHPCVSNIIGLLADRLEMCRDELKPVEIANILFGMQGMAAYHEEVRAVMAALLPKMRECQTIFTPRDIGFSIVGLTTMQPLKLVHEEVWLVLEELNIKVGSSSLKGRPEVLFEMFGRGIKVKQ